MKEATIISGATLTRHNIYGSLFHRTMKLALETNPRTSLYVSLDSVDRLLDAYWRLWIGGVTRVVTSTSSRVADGPQGQMGAIVIRRVASVRNRS
jgi:hypothetical protein